MNRTTVRETLLVVALMLSVVVAGYVSKSTHHITEGTHGAITVSPTADPLPTLPECGEDGIPAPGDVTCQWLDEGQRVVTTYSDGVLSHEYSDGMRIVVFEDGEVWQYNADGSSLLITPGADTEPLPITDTIAA